MRQVIVGLAITVAVSLSWQARIVGQEQQATARQPATIQTGNPTLRASLDRIARGSALWRSDLDAVDGTGRAVLVLTPDEVVVADGRDAQTTKPFESDVVAEISVIPGEATHVQAVMVVVNLPLLNQAHDRRHSTPSERADDLARILIHEVYGHAFPYLVAGDASGRCADPTPGESPLKACAIQRENAVRAELGLGQRRDYGLGSLALARPPQR